MRESHNEQIERWAHYVRDNPATWKKQHTPFINALFDKHNQFVEKMLKTPEGKEKLRELYGVTNKEDYPWLFS